MSVSAELVELVLQHMEEVAVPLVRANESDPSFPPLELQITVHVLRKKSYVRVQISACWTARVSTAVVNTVSFPNPGCTI